MSDSRAVYRQRFELFSEVVPILPLTIQTAKQCAAVQAALRRDGRRVRPRALDLLIAATAFEQGLTLVTNNVADFVDIADLVVEDALSRSDSQKLSQRRPPRQSDFILDTSRARA